MKRMPDFMKTKEWEIYQDPKAQGLALKDGAPQWLIDALEQEIIECELTEKRGRE